MSADVVHLHVASSFSLRYGASTPTQLIERAVEHGQPALALTDRDGLYGAVRFVQGCQKAGLDAVLGVDLAIESPQFEHGRRPGSPRVMSPARTPVRGGQQVDPRSARVTVLARGAGAGLGPGVGWARLCRLVTATHLRGERGRPIGTAELIAEHAAHVGPAAPESDPSGPGAPRWSAAGTGAPAALLVLIGPDSDVGRAVLARHDDLARRLLQRWQQLLPPDAIVVEIVNHGGPPGSPACADHARRLLQLATELGLPTVLTGAVRYADPEQAIAVDVLDAARRLVMLDERHVDRVSTAGHLAPARTLFAAALQVTDDRVRARRLLDVSLDIARDCAQHPRDDIGVGSVHLPEPAALGLAAGVDPQVVLARRCHDAVLTRYPNAKTHEIDQARARLDSELDVVADLGYPTYFLTVTQVCDLIRDMGVRVAARGSGAGSLINYLLGVSGVDPLRHGLLMERFCTRLRAQLPDIDIDVESARRTEVYEQILARFGAHRVTCVSMMETYRVRHAIRDVGSALGLPPGEIDTIAKAFPHVRARDVRNAIADLPELAAYSGSGGRYDVLFDLVERLDGLPRHIALHPCGVVLSDSGLLDRTPVEASWLGFPMSQFDKDDVEVLGLLKLDVLGIRMQSAMAHAVQEIERVEAQVIDLDDREQVPLDDPAVFDLVASTRTLGCFQIESPGQRELIGKFAPSSFDDLIIDISLFRPGPVKSDMITPFLAARQGFAEPDLLHPSLAHTLAQTCGVVVFHEQILHIVSTTSGIGLAEADEVRRALGTIEGRAEVESWWRPRAAARGYEPADVDRIWEVLAAFASFGFCKAHAAAFALPTYQSAWLKAHHPAAFLAGVLTHDPGMYPKRLILDDARGFGVVILGPDINRSDHTYRLERVGDHGEMRGVRLCLADIKGISAAEVQRIVAARPFAGLPDFWTRAQVSRPITERLVLAGAFDQLYGLDVAGEAGLGRRGSITRRDLLLHVAELERWGRSVARTRAGGVRSRRSASPPTVSPRPDDPQAFRTTQDAGVDPTVGDAAGRRENVDDRSGRVRSDPTRPGSAGCVGVGDEVRRRAAAQSQGPAPVVPAERRPAQLMLDLNDTPALLTGTGLPEMSVEERVHAELDILGLDVSGHVLDSYADLFLDLGVVRSGDLRSVRSRREILIGGVKVATQTPPVRSGRRVVFLTLEDSTGPVDATFFEDVQGPYATTIFHSWLLLVRGVVRRTGPMGVSVRATGAWELSALRQEWGRGGLDAVHRAMEQAQIEAAQNAEAAQTLGFGARRVLVHPSGFRQSPYADIRPAGESTAASPRKLWHSSSGSSGH